MLKLENVRAGYNGKVSASGINLELSGNEKILIPGVPRCGKTAILKTAAGIIPPLFGKIHLNDNSFFIPQDIPPYKKTNVILSAMHTECKFIIVDEPFAFLSPSETIALLEIMNNFSGCMLITETYGIYREGFEIFMPEYRKTALHQRNAVYM